METHSHHNAFEVSIKFFCPMNNQVFFGICFSLLLCIDVLHERVFSWQHGFILSGILVDFFNRQLVMK